jgi:ectoine hydroxylase-related dioxygenase (phytanoyl-CoA dioxygenase family)
VYLRILPDGDEFAAKGTGWHRDTWASNIGAQTNWWTPIYPVTAGRTISFAVAHWSEPVPNTSREWDVQAVRARRRSHGADGAKLQLIPEPSSPLKSVPELRIVIEPGDLLCFSGAHLHRTVPNNSGRARFSVEVRTVHGKDIELGRGAPNIDGHAPRIQYGWFNHVLHGTSLADAPALSPHL